MIAAADLATRLLNRPITPQRLRKLARLIDSDQHRADLLTAIEKQKDADAAQQVREGLGA